MLNLFAATGNNNYNAKSCRLYYQSAVNLEEDFPILHEQFSLGNHTISRTGRYWTGIWSDLAIEQVLMKSLKGRGGVISRGLTENVTRVWTKTMHRCAEVTEALETLCEKTTTKGHQETLPGRIKRDATDFKKIFGFFETHNPFIVVGPLMCLVSGLIDDKNSVTCDVAESIGANIQSKMDGKSYADVNFKRKDQITNLQPLYSVVKVNNETVDINPLTLFLRLVTVVERQPETDMVSYFKYELTPYPLSLFKDRILRSNNKSTLRAHLLSGVSHFDSEGGRMEKLTIMDGGALL